jgi:hypothetical protein
LDKSNDTRKLSVCYTSIKFEVTDS